MSDKEVVQRIYSVFGSGDLKALAELVDPECVITQDAALPWGGRHVGHAGLAAFVAALSGSIRSEAVTEALFEADGNVIQVGRTRGSVHSNGASFDVPEVHTWTIRNGGAVAAHFAIDTPGMLAALGAPK